MERNFAMALINQPYVGVTGFMSADQIRQVLAVFPQTDKRVLMAGVMVDRAGPSSRQHPPQAELGKIFFPHPQVLNLVHLNTNKKVDLAGQMEWAMDMAGPHCHGIQLNLDEPDARELYNFKERRPDARVVLQISGRTLRLPPTTLSATVRWGYTGFVDYVLLDPSCGTGLALNPEEILPHLEALLALNIPNLLFGTAGGLGAETLHTIAPIIARYPNISIDATGRIHNGPPQYGLNIAAAQAYVQTAANLLLG